jgi:electron transfer flavoprotein alpha subunit
MMEKILVLAAVEADGTLGRPALEALAAAKELGGAATLGLWGTDVKKAADSVSGGGAGRILGVSGPDFAEARYGSDAAAAEALAKASGAALVLAPGTSRLARVLPGVAHRLGGRADTHVTGLQAGPDGIAASRGYYRQRIESTISRSARPWVISLEPGARPPMEAAPGTAAVEAVAVTLPEGARRTKVEGFRSPAGGGQTIRPDARLLFVAGAGWCKKQSSGQVRTAEAEQLIKAFLEKAQASLGSSKSLVDQKGEGQSVISFLTHLNQVGQTGSTPRHPKGLATCCHGEEPHVVGWRFVPQRRAVNLDANCGWAKGKADVVYVADAFEVMAKVNAMLS